MYLNITFILFFKKLIRLTVTLDVFKYKLFNKIYTFFNRLTVTLDVFKFV